jgi:hypothetical protein
MCCIGRRTPATSMPGREQRRTGAAVVTWQSHKNHKDLTCDIYIGSPLVATQDADAVSIRADTQANPRLAFDGLFADTAGGRPERFGIPCESACAAPGPPSNKVRPSSAILKPESIVGLLPIVISLPRFPPLNRCKPGYAVKVQRTYHRCPTSLSGLFPSNEARSR